MCYNLNFDKIMDYDSPDDEDAYTEGSYESSDYSDLDDDDLDEYFIDNEGHEDQDDDDDDYSIDYYKDEVKYLTKYTEKQEEMIILLKQMNEAMEKELKKTPFTNVYNYVESIRLFVYSWLFGAKT
jgi:hypothetical protein